MATVTFNLFYIYLQRILSCVRDGTDLNPRMDVSLLACVSKADLEAKEKLDYIRAVDKNGGNAGARITYVKVDDKRKVKKIFSYKTMNLYQV